MASGCSLLLPSQHAAAPGAALPEGANDRYGPCPLDLELTRPAVNLGGPLDHDLSAALDDDATPPASPSGWPPTPEPQESGHAHARTPPRIDQESPCPVPACSASATDVRLLCNHVNSTHAAFLAGSNESDVLRVLAAAGLSWCATCISAVPDLVQHECRMTGRLRCPAPGCLASLGSTANLTAHLRNHHSGLTLAEADTRRLRLGRCQHCAGYFRNATQHERTCKERPGSANSRTNARVTARPTGASPLTPAAGTGARLALPRTPATLPGAPSGLTWTFGPPGGLSGSSRQMSWAFVPMIRCALGHNEDAGLARFSAGAADWDRWRLAYATDFATRNITEASLPFTAAGYLNEQEQVRLLLGPAGGGESNVDDLMEGEFMEWVEREARLAALRRAAAPRPPPRESGSSTGDPLDDCDGTGSDRLPSASILEHERLWWYLPEGCSELWVAANRPRFQTLLAAHRANDTRALGHALDAILATPAECLVRRRGGVRAVASIRRRLRTVAAAARRGTHAASGPVLIEPPAALPSDTWAGQIRRAAELASRGDLRRATRALTRDAAPICSPAAVESLRRKHPPATAAIPACPAHAPRIVVDRDDLIALVRKLAPGCAASGPGWSAALLKPLMQDDVCVDGVVLLVQLVANNELDPSSRALITTSLLLGIPKPNQDIRPIAIGDLFLKLAARYCFNLDAHRFPSVFEPLQLAIGSPGGCERAVQTLQAKLETNPDGLIAIHVDFSNAYNSVNRAQMLASVFGDERLSHLWRVLSFSYGEGSDLVIRNRGCIVDTVRSEQGGKQGCVLAGLGFAHVLQHAYATAVAGFPDITARAIVDDFSMVGPPAQVFQAYDRLIAAAQALSVMVNTSKTVVQQARGAPTPATTAAATERGLSLVLGNHDYLGAYIGVDDEAGREWLLAKLLRLSPVSRAIQDTRLPSILAIQLTKTCVITTPGYLARCLPLRVTRDLLRTFDNSILTALTARLRLPNPLPITALQSLTQPMDQGGMGIRSLNVIAPAAKWASAAAVAPDLQALVDASAEELPFVTDRTLAYDLMLAAGVPTTDLPTAAEARARAEAELAARAALSGRQAVNPRFANEGFKLLPRRADLITSFYGGECALPTLQRMLSRQMERASLRAFEASPEFDPMDMLRFAACKAPESGLWLLPNPALPLMIDRHTETAVRLRLGLPPAGFSERVCLLCDRDISADPWHAFACEAIRRLSITKRHDHAAYHLCEFSRSQGCLSNVVAKDPGALIPDGEIFLARDSIFFDVSGVHSLAPSHFRPHAPLGSAVAGREDFKETKYAEYATERHARIVPFVLDCFGALGQGALDLVDLIEEEGKTPGFGAALPARMSKQLFLTMLSQKWQTGNALAVEQWQQLSRQALSSAPRTAPRPSPLAALVTPPCNAPQTVMS